MRTVVEFIPESAIADLPTALALHRAIGSTQLGLMVDSWHLARSGGVPADVATIPPAILKSLFNHPLTDKGLQSFLADWKKTGQSI